MYKPISEAYTIRTDYTKTTAKVFQEITELWIAQGLHSTLWRDLNLEPSVRRDRTLPSWALYFAPSNSQFAVPPGGDLWQYRELKHRNSVDGDVMTMSGLLFDTIAVVSENVLEQNMTSLILAFNDRVSVSAAYETNEVAAAAFWQTLIAFDPAKNDGKNYQQEGACCLSWWMLTDFGLTLDVVASNPMLEDVANSHPALVQAHSSQVQSEMDVETFVAENRSVRAMLGFANFGCGQDFRTKMAFTLYWAVLKQDKGGILL
jgi:hypothetical protein